MWIPEVSLGNATFQEPVQDVEKVPKTRWKLVRSRCHIHFYIRLIKSTVMLHLQTENGRLYPVRTQIMF